MQTNGVGKKKSENQKKYWKKSTQEGADEYCRNTNNIRIVFMCSLFFLMFVCTISR